MAKIAYIKSLAKPITMDTVIDSIVWPDKFNCQARIFILHYISGGYQYLSRVVPVVPGWHVSCQWVMSVVPCVVSVVPGWHVSCQWVMSVVPCVVSVVPGWHVSCQWVMYCCTVREEAEASVFCCTFICVCAVSLHSRRSHMRMYVFIADICHTDKAETDRK